MANTADDPWLVHELTGDASELHHHELEWRRSIVLMRVNAAAVVLGSTQSLGDVNETVASQSRLGIAQRRSGGGLVYLDSDAVWIDVVMGRHDPLYRHDVSQSMVWLGRAWVEVLEHFGIQGSVHTGEMLNKDAGRHLCFAGLAPGEVTIGGAKAIGISQRRGRHGARFQCVSYRRWNPQLWVDVVNSAAMGGAVGNLVGELSVATVDVDGVDLAERLAQTLANKGNIGM